MYTNLNENGIDKSLHELSSEIEPVAKLKRLTLHKKVLYSSAKNDVFGFGQIFFGRPPDSKMPKKAIAVYQKILQTKKHWEYSCSIEFESHRQRQ